MISQSNPAFRARSVSRMVVSCTVLVTVLLSCGTTPSPIEFESAPLHGMIFDEQHKPVAWVSVSTDDAGQVNSDIEGRFIIPDVRRGVVTVRAERAGYEPHMAEFTFVNRTQVLYLRLLSGRHYVREAIGAFDTGDLATAFDLAERAVAIVPDDAEARYLAAIAAVRLGDVQTARSHLAALSGSGMYEAVSLLRADMAMQKDGEQ